MATVHARHNQCGWVWATPGIALFWFHLNIVERILVQFSNLDKVQALFKYTMYNITMKQKNWRQKAIALIPVLTQETYTSVWQEESLAAPSSPPPAHKRYRTVHPSHRRVWTSWTDISVLSQGPIPSPGDREMFLVVQTQTSCALHITGCPVGVKSV